MGFDKFYRKAKGKKAQFDETINWLVGNLAAVDTAGGVYAIANPLGANVLIDMVILDITTASTAACTIDAGCAAANATTSNDNLIDGLDVHSATGQFQTISNGGTNGLPVRKWASDKYFTISKASGATAGLVGKVYIRYRKA